ncbi:MAG TPA: peptidoglycan -binding protein [Burkholderiales bacterium]|nr:peptidoglycan -binding protein [Burkholderiales bacterium]
MLALARRSRAGVNVWPAFVDALASVLLVLVFMLLVFVLGQYLLSVKLTGRERALEELNRQVSQLADTLAMERGRAATLREQLAATLTDLERASGEAEQASGTVGLLNQQVGALREQLERLNAALEASEAKATEREREIERLGERLNVALAKKAEELQRYRSEFFGRLRELLGEHPSIRVVGDRFVFQSELLFPSGEAALTPAGEKSLTQLADTLKTVTKKIPSDIQWVLSIHGHTDRRPIATARFPSNWELSTARALSVVRFLAARGIPEKNLAAAGFGEHQPVDTGESADAYARNRRIEIKLTPP